MHLFLVGYYIFVKENEKHLLRQLCVVEVQIQEIQKDGLKSYLNDKQIN